MKVMKIAIISLLLILPNSVHAQNQTVGTFSFEDRNGNQIAKLAVRTRAFDPSRHTLTIADLDTAKLITKVDGRAPLGTDGTIPRVEITSMIVSFSGKKIVVPPSLFADCFNPNFYKDAAAVKLSDSGDSLLVFMAGSDGAGSYQIMWILRKDGRHSRFINDCSDCDFRGVLNFFNKQ